MRVEGVFRGYRLTRALAPGDVVFYEGDAGDQMFGILEGEVTLMAAGETVAVLGPDGTFGEMAIVDGSPRSATAVATAQTTLAVIDYPQFLFLVQETPAFALQVMASLADRLRGAKSPTLRSVPAP